MLKGCALDSEDIVTGIPGRTSVEASPLHPTFTGTQTQQAA